MWRDLPAVLAGPAADPGVRVLVVTGAGSSFCAGADIADLLGGPDAADPMAALRRDNLAAQAALREFPKPTVAMVRGHCIGGGVELATCCDLRFTDDTGVFGVTPAKVGIVYTPESTKALVDLVGPALTRYLLFSGELVDAPTALRTGLVDRLLPADELEPEVRRFAGVLAVPLGADPAVDQGGRGRPARRRRRPARGRPLVPRDDRGRRAGRGRRGVRRAPRPPPSPGAAAA